MKRMLAIFAFLVGSVYLMGCWLSNLFRDPGDNSVLVALIGVQGVLWLILSAILAGQNKKGDA